MAALSVGEIVKISHTEPDGLKYIFHVVIIERRGDFEFIGRAQRIFAAGPDVGQIMCGNDICRRFKGERKTFKNSDIVQ
jgi:hypothetical protein